MEIAQAELTVPRPKAMDATSSAVIKTLIYFNVFNYPLNEEELLHYCQSYSCNAAGLKSALCELLDEKFIEASQGFYFLPGRCELVERRIKGNKAASQKLKQAKRISNFIAHFPFVESVSISGSLSKNYMDKDSDIDFFIITRPHRLWLCRGLLVSFKKFFLFNSSRHFCINYYLDTENLTIPDQNIFTATEISFLKPTFNWFVFEEFLRKNDWCKFYYPNKPASPFLGQDRQASRVKLFLQWVLNGWLGEKLDTFFFKVTLNRWKRKFSHFNKEDFDLNLRSRKHVSKHHPRGYQKKVLESFELGQQQFEMQFNVKLSANPRAMQ